MSYGTTYYTGIFNPIVVLTKTSSKVNDSYALHFSQATIDNGSTYKNTSSNSQNTNEYSYPNCSFIGKNPNAGSINGNAVYNDTQFGMAYSAISSFQITDTETPIDWTLNSYFLASSDYSSTNITNSVVLNSYGISFTDGSYLKPKLNFNNISLSNNDTQYKYYCKLQYTNNQTNLCGLDSYGEPRVPAPQPLPNLNAYCASSSGGGGNGDCSIGCNDSNLTCKYINNSCTLSCITPCYVGNLDINNSTILYNSTSTNMYGTCITTVTANDPDYNFTTLSLRPNYVGTQKNNWTPPTNSGWTLLVDSEDSLETIPYNTNLPEEAHGVITIRYCYNYGGDDITQTSFFKDKTQISTLATFVTYITSSSIGSKDTGKTSLLFTDFSGCSHYITKTVSYIFLYYFYAQLYQYQEFSINQALNLNTFYSKSNNQYNIMTGIPSFIQDNIITYYNQIITGTSNSTITLPPVSTFVNWFIPPTVTVVDTNDNNVYLRCYLPVRMIYDFFTQSFENQSSLVSTYLVNFFNEHSDQYYSGNNATNKSFVQPSLYRILPTMLHPVDSSGTLLDIIQSIGNNMTQISSSSVFASHVMWVDLHTNTTYLYQGGSVFDMSGHDVSATFPVSLFSSAYTTMDSSAASITTDPFVLSVGVTVCVTKWSPKSSAYCLQQLSKNASSIITIPQTNPTTQDPLYTIYLNMSRSGWIPSPLYPIIMPQITDNNTIREILLTFCNTYLTPMRNSDTSIFETYSYLYTWLVSRNSTGNDGSGNDCASVFSLLAPAGTPAPNVTAMCFDTNIQSMSTKVREAFGVTPAACSSKATCNVMNEWMTTSNLVNKAKNKNTFDTEAYATNCGSVYTNASPKTAHKSIVVYGIILILLIGLLLGLLCSVLQVSSLYTTMICSILIISLGIGLYYLSTIFVGKWSCSARSPNKNSTAVCKSVTHPSLLLPDEFCTDTTPNCECLGNSDCSFLGVVPPVTVDASGQCLYKKDASGNCYTPYVDASGQCIHGSDAQKNCYTGSCVAGECVVSGKVRPVKTVTYSKMISYVIFYFLVLLACLLPTLCILFSYVIPTKLSTRVIGVLCILFFLLPLLYLYKNYSTTVNKTVYKDNTTSGGSSSFVQKVAGASTGTGTIIPPPTSSSGITNGSPFPQNTTIKITNISGTTFDTITCYDDKGNSWATTKVVTTCSDPNVQPDANGQCKCYVPCTYSNGTDSTFGNVCFDSTSNEYQFNENNNISSNPCYCPTFDISQNNPQQPIPKTITVCSNGSCSSETQYLPASINCTCNIQQTVYPNNLPCTITTRQNSVTTPYIPNQSIYITIGAISSLTCILTKNGINYITVLGNVNGTSALFTTSSTILSFSLGLGSEINIQQTYPGYQISPPLVQPLQNTSIPSSITLSYPSGVIPPQPTPPTFLLQEFVNTNGIPSSLLPSTISSLSTIIPLTSIVNNGYILFLQQYSSTPNGLFGLVLYNNKRTLSVITLGQPFLLAT
jgi:hypothetical protein